MASPDNTAANDGNAKLIDETGASRGKAEPDMLHSLNYSLLIFGFSLLSVFNVAVLLLAQDEMIRNVVLVVDVPLTIIFFVDFIIRFRSAESKTAYFFRQLGWADLLSSLPFPIFKIFRVFRIIRARRLVGHYGARNLRREFRIHRADSALALIAFLIICVTEFGSILVTLAERSNQDANIKTASDALWWAVVTLTTLGYGDRYPTTDPGRIVGVVVMITGVALLGVLTGYLANKFLAPPKPSEEDMEQAAEPSPDPRAMLADLQRLISEQEKAQEELRSMIAELKQVSSR